MKVVKLLQALSVLFLMNSKKLLYNPTTLTKILAIKTRPKLQTTQMISGFQIGLPKSASIARNPLTFLTGSIIVGYVGIFFVQNARLKGRFNRLGCLILRVEGIRSEGKRISKFVNIAQERLMSISIELRIRQF